MDEAGGCCGCIMFATIGLVAGAILKRAFLFLF